MRPTILKILTFIVLPILLLLTGCAKKTIKPDQSGGDAADSPIVVSDSSSGTRTQSVSSGPATAPAPAPAYIRHAGFILDSSPDKKPIVLVHDVIPGWWFFKTERKVTFFEVNSNPLFHVDLTQYGSWNLKITTKAGYVFTLGSADNKTITIDPGTMTLSPAFDRATGDWSLFNSDLIQSAILSATDSSSQTQQLYPSPQNPPKDPETGKWEINLHYCKKKGDYTPPPGK